MPGGEAEPVIVYNGRIYGLSPYGYRSTIELILEVEPERFEAFTSKVTRHDRGYPLGPVRLLAPLAMPRNIICTGLNYRRHLEETGLPAPQVPELFAKSPSSVIGPGDPIILHSNRLEPDVEVELAAVIGRPSRSLSEEEAREAVWGYMVFNDFTSRHEEFGLGVSQWWRSKSHDAYAPIGPVIVPRTLVSENDLRLEAWVGGTLVRRGSSSEMIFSVERIVAWASTSTRLYPGDIVSTGTPAGVGEGGRTPRRPSPGDTVTVCISGLGCVGNPVIEDYG